MKAWFAMGCDVDNGGRVFKEYFSQNCFHLLIQGVFVLIAKFINNRLRFRTEYRLFRGWGRLS